jgi:hypothetical protein
LKADRAVPHAPARPRGTASAAPALITAWLCACASLTHETIAVDAADAADRAATASVALVAAQPVILRGVDGKMLSSVHVPNAVRSYTFVMSPGPHELWVSTVPYANAQLAQHVGCYVLRATLAAGAEYQLRFDPGRIAAVLLPVGSSQPAAVGELIDQPLIVERACRWP